MRGQKTMLVGHGNDVAEARAPRKVALHPNRQGGYAGRRTSTLDKLHTAPLIAPDASPRRCVVRLNHAQAGICSGHFVFADCLDRHVARELAAANEDDMRCAAPRGIRTSAYHNHAHRSTQTNSSPSLYRRRCSRHAALPKMQRLRRCLAVNQARIRCIIQQQGEDLKRTPT